MNAPYGGMYDHLYPGSYPYAYPYAATSGPDDGADEGFAEAIAEQVAEDFANVHQTSGYDSGAFTIPGLGIKLPSPEQILRAAQAKLQQLGLPMPPALSNKVIPKVVAKLPPKVQAKAAAAAPPRPAMNMILPRIPAPSLPAAVARKPITSVRELMQRVKWAQLANLTGSPLTVGAGGSTTTTVAVTRTGWVLDWVTNNAAAELVISALTYAQQPNTVFNPTPFGSWSPLAANPTPIDPLFVTMPATFQVTIANPTAGALIATWTMSGIPAEHVSRALMDPDVAEFLANRGMDIARATQGGQGGWG